MFARVTNLQGPPEQVEQTLQTLRERSLSAALALPGIKGIMTLVNRSTGKWMTLALYESDEALREAAEPGERVRAEAAARTRSQIISVEEYEVAIYEM